MSFIFHQSEDSILFFSIKKTYKDHLMQSIWMESPAPQDLQAKWVMVPVPKGSRHLIVAGNGRTMRYSRKGVFKGSFASLLEKKPDYTILDTIFDHANGTYYILDVMMLNGFAFYDCDTNFRFIWLKSKILEDFKGIDERLPGKNFYAFKPLTSYDTKQETIEELFSTSGNFCFSPSELDGVLFYHKDAVYFPGHTPLVTWLNGYMLPEYLGVTVGDDILADQPIDYVGAAKEIQKFESNYIKNKCRKMGESKKVMETANKTMNENQNC